MKTIVCLFLVVGVACCVTACRKTDVRTFEITVPEMKSAKDVQAVQAALVNLAGVQANRTAVDDVRRVVTVTYDSMLTARKNIEFTIAEAGYQANSIPPKPVRVDSFTPGQVEPPPSAQP